MPYCPHRKFSMELIPRLYTTFSPEIVAKALKSAPESPWTRCGGFWCQQRHPSIDMEVIESPLSEHLTQFRVRCDNDAIPDGALITAIFEGLEVVGVAPFRCDTLAKFIAWNDIDIARAYKLKYKTVSACAAHFNGIVSDEYRARLMATLADTCV